MRITPQLFDDGRDLFGCRGFEILYSMSTPLLNASNLSLEIGGRRLFESISIRIEERERIALIGPNGSGKSSLLKVFAGELEPDDGQVNRRSDVRIALVRQEDRFDEQRSILEVASQTIRRDFVSESEREALIKVSLGKMGFHDPSLLVSSLSGGWKKRLSIARALIEDPQLLLLDEPTNHLDVESIQWLEEFLKRAQIATIFVSHDRYFIEHLADRVFEINGLYPNGYFQCAGNYSEFLEKREAHIAGLKESHASRANKVRREISWLRQGAPARTTKSKHRIASAEQMIGDLEKSKVRERKVNIEFSASYRKTKELIKVENISKGFDNKKLFQGISLLLTSGTKLGLIGANGSGKTTFLKILLKQLQPDTGKVIHASNLRYAYFDQSRRQIDPLQTVKNVLAPDSDSVVFQGRSIHLASWLFRFLFSADHANREVRSLSGGEQARLLLAKLMLEEQDVLIFDEPTNDLDISTLEVLEEAFLDFPGALIVVTHDRYFLEQTTNLVFGFHEGKGAVFANYHQWEVGRKDSIKTKVPDVEKVKKEAPSATSSKKQKLTYKEQREFTLIEKQITDVEERVKELQTQSASSEIVTNAETLVALCNELSEKQKLLETLYTRWEELAGRLE